MEEQEPLLNAMDLDTKSGLREPDVPIADILKGDVIVGAIGGEEARQGVVCRINDFYD